MTGANAWVGYALVAALSRLGANVTMACRNQTRCERAAHEIRAQPQSMGALRTMIMDTASMASVRAFARSYLGHSNGVQPPLDMLFLNAGSAYASPEKKKKCVPINADGIEHVFAGNYLGHHLLYRWLEPALLRSATGGRVVSTSSGSSFQTYSYHVATDLPTLNGCSEPFQRGFVPLSHGQSKMAQIVWTKHLARRLGPDSNAFVNAFHPGVVATDFADKLFRAAAAPAWVTTIVVPWVARTVLWTPAEGALTGLYSGAAVERLKREQVRGKYFHPQSQEVHNELANNITLQEKVVGVFRAPRQGLFAGPSK